MLGPLLLPPVVCLTPPLPPATGCFPEEERHSAHLHPHALLLPPLLPGAWGLRPDSTSRGCACKHIPPSSLTRTRRPARPLQQKLVVNWLAEMEQATLHRIEARMRYAPQKALPRGMVLTPQPRGSPAEALRRGDAAVPRRVLLPAQEDRGPHEGRGADAESAQEPGAPASPPA